MTEVYKISIHFGGVEPNSVQLEKEVKESSIVTVLNDIDGQGDFVKFRFVNQITPAEKLTLDQIVTNHIPEIQLDSSSTSYDAIIDAKGRGDYLLPSQAFAAGAKTVYIRNGKYVESTDIIIPDHGVFIGESASPVVIEFTGPYCIKIDGSGGIKESIGTISIANGSSTVTGVGTTFSNLQAGDGILLDKNFYKIETISSNTSLIIDVIYNGKALNNISFIAQKMKSSITLQNLCIGGSTVSGIYMRGVSNTLINSCGFMKNQKGIEMIDSSNVSFMSCNSTNNSDSGYKMENCISINHVNGISHNNGNYGFCVIGQSQNVVFNGIVSSNNHADGVHFGANSEKMIVNDCAIENNNGHGINCDINTKNILIDGTIVTNNDDGIIIRGIGNIISSCIIRDNNIGILIINGSLMNVVDGSKIQDNGTGIEIQAGANDNIVDSNIASGNASHGIHIHANNCVISGNRCLLNGGDGCHIAAGADSNIVKVNRFTGNTGQDFVDNGTNTQND